MVARQRFVSSLQCKELTMTDKPTYEAFKQRVRELEKSNFELKRAVEPL